MNHPSTLYTLHSTPIETREYQTKIVEKTLKLFNGGRDSVMIESPVGSGKTIMGLKIIQALLSSTHPGMTVNWVANRHHLLRQVEETNRDHFKLDLNLISMFDKNPPPADMVILDEAHHDATVSSANIYAKAHNQLTLGLSATPLRTDKMKLSFQSTVKECGIPRLINDGYLSAFVQYVIPQWTPAAVADIYLKDPESWGKSLVFFRTKKECYEFQSILNRHDPICDVITGETDKDPQIAKFESGATRVVANVQMLTEGFDLPELQTVFVRDAGRLPTIQMGGRGLRRAPGKEHCNIIQSQHTRYSFSKLAKPLDTLMLDNDIWLSSGGNSRRVSEALKETTLRIAARGKVKLPRFSKKKQSDIKAHYRTYWRNWQNGLNYLPDPEDQIRYLQFVVKQKNMRKALEVVDYWIDEFGNREEAEKTLAFAEEFAYYPDDFHRCSTAWETRFHDYPAAVRCIKKAIKNTRSDNRKRQYKIVLQRLIAHVVP